MEGTISLEKRDIETIKEIVEKTFKVTEEKMISMEERLDSKMTSMEERLRVTIAASEERMRQQIEELAHMASHEFVRMGKRIMELSNRLQLVERRIAQLETRFGMMEEDLQLYREKSSQVASELEAFRRRVATMPRKGMIIGRVNNWGHNFRKLACVWKDWKRLCFQSNFSTQCIL